MPAVATKKSPAPAATEAFEGIDPRTVAPAGAVIGAPVPPPAPPPAPPPPAAGRALMIEVPYAPSAGYAPRHLDRALTGTEAETLRNVCAALLADGVVLADGRPVQAPHDALRWILAQVRSAADARA